MNKLLVLIGIAGMSGTALFATTTYAFIDNRASNQNSEVYNGAQEDISPYGGSIGTSISGGTGNLTVKFFCDDFEDNVTYGTGWQVNLTAVNSSNLSNTRYGSANLNPSYPSGTTLYEEVAWLFTQTVQPGQSLNNQDAIQEAVWLMTGNPASTPKVTATATGSNKTYLQWIAAAQSDFNSTVAGYATPDYNQWLIVTDPAATGNTGGAGKQEFLAYYTANGIPQTATSSLQSTPEPSTCAMAGLGFLIAGLGGRRRRR
jgi:hypothetical protein